MFWTFEAVFKLRNLRKLHILRLRARSVICIKNRQNSQEGGTTFARHVQILPRHRLTNQKRFLCFNQEQITKELGPRVPQSSQSRSQSFVPLDQRSENESSGSNHFEITMGNNRILVIRFTAQSQSASISCYGACLKWLLPELSFSDRWSRGTKLWERDCRALLSVRHAQKRRALGSRIS